MTTWNDLLKPGEANDFFTRDFPPFEPEVTAYSPTNARWLAELCRLIYRNNGRGVFLGRAGLAEVTPFDKQGTQAFLVRATQGPAFAALVFRGSDDLQAWITNLKALPKQLGNGVTVHEGFEEALDVVWPEVEAAIDGIIDATKEPLFFSGHSLGAALATLAAGRRAPRALYTFGSPLVGNTAFVETLHRIPIYRVDDGHDIVPTLPPENLGYAHAGELHALQAKKEILKYDTLAKFWELVKDAVEPPAPLADHAPINYVTRI